MKYKTKNSPFCDVDGETEYFNGESWIPLKELHYKDYVLQYHPTGKATLTKEVVVHKNEKKTSYRYELDDRFYMICAWNDQIPFITRRGVLRSQRFSTIIDQYYCDSFTGRLIGAFNYKGEGIDLEGIHLDLITLINEGVMIDADNKRTKVLLRKPNQILGLENMLSNLPIKFDRKEINPYLVQYTLYEYEEYKNFLISRYQFNVTQAKYLIKRMEHWNGGAVYTTDNKDNADYYQFLVSSIGRRAEMRTIKYKNGNIKYAVKQRKTPYLSLPIDETEDEKSSHIKKAVHEDGKAYSLEVPTGMIVYRRRNNIFVLGNPKSATER